MQLSSGPKVKGEAFFPYRVTGNVYITVTIFPGMRHYMTFSLPQVFLAEIALLYIALS